MFHLNSELLAFLLDFLRRAASSITLNLAEGYDRKTTADRKHFFTIAFGSLRESVAICDLGGSKTASLAVEFDKLAASILQINQSKINKV